MNKGISIIICCYNSVARLPETLRHLALQKVSANLDWEIIVVDNASTDGTAETAIHSCPVELRERLRVVSEPTPGLSSARIKGIREARHELVSFVDDDNWVNPDFVESASEIFSWDCSIGLAGGPSVPVYEIPPPKWIEQIKGYYAIGEQQPHEGDISNNPGTLLWGAGMCVRRLALLDLLNGGFSFLLSDRHGSSLETGGDTELCFILRDRGWKLRYDRRLSILHYIPRQRLTWSYAMRLFRGAGRASVYLEIYLLARKQQESKIDKIKKTWIFQFARSLKNLSTLAVKDPIYCIFNTEGNLTKLRMIAAWTYIKSLVSLFGVYRKTIEKVSFKIN